MTSNHEQTPHSGWPGRLLRAVMVAAVGIAGLGASCVEPVTSGGDAGDRRDGAGVADVTAAECRALENADSCREQSGCQWLTATCDGGRIVGGCFAGSAWGTAAPDCSLGRDAAGSDADTDAGVEGCGVVGTETACRARSACRWWTAYCGSRRVAARCIDRGTTPAPPECGVADAGDVSGSSDTGAVDAADTGGYTPDAGAASDASADAADLDAGFHCRMHSNASDCRADARCKWWVDSCDGYVIEETCVSKDESPTPTTCKKIPPANCHDVESEGACRPPNCEWVAEGCGAGPVDTVEVTACLPEGQCRDDGDCPTGHSCVHLWTDVCYGSACQACGGETRRCVADELLKP